MSESVWIDQQDAVLTQLELQVRLSFDRHHRFLVEHGLEECRRVVDVGTGNGLFLSRVAEKHPGISFSGIDNQTNMIGAAELRNCPNIRWVQADALDSATAALLEQADGILMRYFLLHLLRSEASLGQMLGVVKLGTRLWVFDLDTDHSRCEPPDVAFDEFNALVQEFTTAHGIATRTGALLPPILGRLGFEVEAVSVEPFNNREIDPVRFAEYLYREAMLYHYCLHGTTGVEELRNLKQFLEADLATKKHFVQYGMIMVGARRQ